MARRRQSVSSGRWGRFYFRGAIAAVAVLVPLAPELVSGTTGVAHASIMIALDLPTLVQQADHIAVVEVAKTTAAWDERHERIYSTIELNVIENWKTPTSGATSTPAHLTVVQPGGTVGDIRMTVTGMGTFAPGERSLVFLRGPANHAQVVGMTQGKRPMRFEPASQKWVVTPPDLRQAKLVRPTVRPNVDLKALTPAPAVPPTMPATVPAPSVTTAPSPTINIPRELPADDLRIQIKRLLGAAGQ